VPNKLTESSDNAAEFKSEGAGFECRLGRQFPPPTFPVFSSAPSHEEYIKLARDFL